MYQLELQARRNFLPHSATALGFNFCRDRQRPNCPHHHTDANSPTKAMGSKERLLRRMFDPAGCTLFWHLCLPICLQGNYQHQPAKPVACRSECPKSFNCIKTELSRVQLQWICIAAISKLFRLGKATSQIIAPCAYNSFCQRIKRPRL